MSELNNKENMSSNRAFICVIFLIVVPSTVSSRFVSNIFSLSRSPDGANLCEVSLPDMSQYASTHTKCTLECQVKVNCQSVNWDEETRTCDIYLRQYQSNLITSSNQCSNYVMINFVDDAILLPEIHANFKSLENICTNRLSEKLGWKVVQRRCNGVVDFDKPWNDYSYGFGSLKGEFWIGNEYLVKLTGNGSTPRQVRFDLIDNDGVKRYAIYDYFTVAGNLYTLTVSGYSGDAGDPFSYVSGSAFTTYDFDNDIWSSPLYSDNCAVLLKCGGWFVGCCNANINGFSNYLSSKQYSLNWSPYFNMQYLQMSVKYA